MSDVVSAEKRSKMMSNIGSKNTMPELSIRSGLHQSGFRFRIHHTKLPGKPDIVFPKHKAVIFIHGCFWHKHQCHLFKWPKSNHSFWNKKLMRNEYVDSLNILKLRKLGWRIGIVWECAIKGRTRIPLAKVIKSCTSWLLSNKKLLEIKGRV